MLSDVDVPITVSPEVAEQIIENLRDGHTVGFDVDPEDAPDLADRLEWQLAHERPITTFVEDYDGE